MPLRTKKKKTVFGGAATAEAAEAAWGRVVVDGDGGG